VSATPDKIENGQVLILLNPSGEITSILDKSSGRELAAGKCNAFLLFKDITTVYDAWDIDSMYARLPVPPGIGENASVSVIESGPLVARVSVTKRIHDSQITQVISLAAESRRIEFDTTVDWHETHKLLKVSFPTAIHSDQALHEIQFGFVKRPNHASRQYDQDRFEVCNHRWTALSEANRGCAVLNDSKYGVGVTGGNIHLTLLKSATAPDLNADRGVHRFTYAFYFWNGPFVESGVTREAFELNSPVLSVDGEGGEESLFAVDAPTIIIDTLKAAEDGSGNSIVRLYECAGASSRCVLATKLSVARASECDMLEELKRELPAAGGRIELDFRPFEVKTLRLS
jgi:alpha-mannosidase